MKIILIWICAILSVPLLALVTKLETEDRITYIENDTYYAGVYTKSGVYFAYEKSGTQITQLTDPKTRFDKLRAKYDWQEEERMQEWYKKYRNPEE